MFLFHSSLSTPVLHHYLCFYFSTYSFGVLIIRMANSGDLAEYLLTKWNIDDDSLSYIDHDYWQELINQIVESRWGMKASALSRDRLFRKAFDSVNRPSHYGGSKLKRCSNFSEARRFKVMVASIWNISGMS